jgi:hypothetical protein
VAFPSARENARDDLPAVPPVDAEVAVPGQQHRLVHESPFEFTGKLIKVDLLVIQSPIETSFATPLKPFEGWSQDPRTGRPWNGEAVWAIGTADTEQAR